MEIENKTDMQIIQESYDQVSGLEPVYARLALQNAIAYVQADFFSLMKTTATGSLPHTIPMVEGETVGQEKAILSLVAGLDVEKAVTYLNSIDQAIEKGIISSLEGKITSDLGLKFLSDGEFAEMRAKKSAGTEKPSDGTND